MRSILSVFAVLLAASSGYSKPPNILLIITDDQGYGDLGIHGNPKIRTPHLDRLAGQSAQFSRFYVCPVCSPTRSALLTGRYTYRTGVVDTFVGRSLMHPDEVTLAEMLGKHDYKTGLFGKWHLGDNYPLRAADQGFQRVLAIRGGGIGQPSDPPGGESYFDPILLDQSELKKHKGYCTDIFADEAIRFIEKNQAEPFFAYVAFNCPHGPLQVANDLVKPYTAMNLALSEFPKGGFPVQGKYSEEETARIYAMVENIDTNVGRMLAKLDELKLADNTIVVFLTDNGPQQVRYNAGWRGRKGSVYEGGIRVPCFVRWPGKIEPRKITPWAAHIDMVPTLMDACGLPLPKERKLDGRSLLPLLRGEKVAWPDRTYFVQWHRGEVPQLNRACAAIGPRYKAVQAQGANAEVFKKEPGYQLFDLEKDPYEQTDLAAEQPQVLRQLRGEYEAWFADVKKEREFLPPRIHIGSEHENPTSLTRQDWRGPNAGWTPTSEGHWQVKVENAGPYRIKLTFAADKEERTAHFRLGNRETSTRIAAGSKEATFDAVELVPGDGQLEAWLKKGESRTGVHYVDLLRTTKK